MSEMDAIKEVKVTLEDQAAQIFALTAIVGCSLSTLRSRGFIAEVEAVLASASEIAESASARFASKHTTEALRIIESFRSALD